MRLKQPFLKLPIRFDADALAAEARSSAFGLDYAPTGFIGNKAVTLVTPRGLDSDAIEGPMAGTEGLDRCDHVQHGGDRRCLGPQPLHGPRAGAGSPAGYRYPVAA